MNKKQIISFQKTEDQLESLYREMGVLSKKKPDSAINKFKLRFINRVILKATSLLGDSFRPFEGFDQFDEDELPSYSDVVMMLAQYLRSMDACRVANTYYDGYTPYRVIDGKKSDWQTKEAKDWTK